MNFFDFHSKKLLLFFTYRIFILFFLYLFFNQNLLYVPMVTVIGSVGQGANAFISIQ